MYSSGEDSFIKTRKPYTITKQRERWTDEEHTRFLEALKLHGRAWQRIEEHIGTKTAVQIRSHAQKFFSKLEKEAVIKGVPLKQTLDIDIPPPRPKKKPSNPYPRKTSAGTYTSSPDKLKDGKLFKSASSVYSGEQILDLETDSPPEKPDGTENSTRVKETLDETDRSEVLTLFHEAPCTSISSARKSPSTSIGFVKTHAFREFMPLTKEMSNHGPKDECGSYLTLELKANQKSDTTNANYVNLDNSVSEVSNQDNSCKNSHEQLVHGKKTNGVRNQPENLVRLATEKLPVDQDCARHLPVHVVNVSSRIINPESNIHQPGAAYGSSTLFTSPTSSATSQHHSNNISATAIPQLLPDFSHPFTSICNNQDTSHIFSSLIMSTLLQNPAAHAAASLAASLWPCTNLAASVDSLAGTTFPLRQTSPSQNMASIAAVTVAAASAWWAANGLFPMCPPLHAVFTSVPASITADPTETTGQAPMVNKEIKENIIKNPPPESQLSEGPDIQGSDSKGSPPSSSDSEESGDVRLETKLVENADDQLKPLPEIAVQDSNKGKVREQMYRSSCGSNTASSSEVETTALENQENTKEESTQPDVNHLAGFDLNNHRSRFTGNINESWKEVSEEGRLAFQALFSREVLPQSFLRQRDPRINGELKNNEDEQRNQNSYAKDGELRPQIDLFNTNLWMGNTHFIHGGMEKNESLLNNSGNAREGSSPMRVGIAHTKLKGYRTGFKPYKRCSVEESRVLTAEAKSSKRIRLEEDAASTR